MYKYINTTIAVIIIIIIIFHVYINFAYWMDGKRQINNLENEVYIINRKMQRMKAHECPFYKNYPLHHNYVMKNWI